MELLDKKKEIRRSNICKNQDTNLPFFLREAHSFFQAKKESGIDNPPIIAIASEDTNHPIQKNIIIMNGDAFEDKSQQIKISNYEKKPNPS